MIIFPLPNWSVLPSVLFEISVDYAARLLTSSPHGMETGMAWEESARRHFQNVIWHLLDL
jgi:hypothetical protein